MQSQQSQTRHWTPSTSHVFPIENILTDSMILAEIINHVRKMSDQEEEARGATNNPGDNGVIFKRL